MVLCSIINSWLIFWFMGNLSKSNIGRISNAWSQALIFHFPHWGLYCFCWQWGQSRDNSSVHLFEILMKEVSSTTRITRQIVSIHFCSSSSNNLCFFNYYELVPDKSFRLFISGKHSSFLLTPSGKDAFFFNLEIN